MSIINERREAKTKPMNLNTLDNKKRLKSTKNSKTKQAILFEKRNRNKGNP